MGTRILYDEVQPYQTDVDRLKAIPLGAKVLASLLVFATQSAILSVIMYAVSWLPIEDKTPAYLVAACAYTLTVVLWSLSEVNQSTNATRAHLIHVHDDVASIRHKDA